MTYRETLINEMIKNGTNNCEVEEVFIDRMDLIYNMADSLDYKYGDKLTMGHENARKVALDNFREMCRYADSIEGKEELYDEFCFYEGVIGYVWNELLSVYKFEGITDEVLENIAVYNGEVEEVEG